MALEQFAASLVHEMYSMNDLPASVLCSEQNNGLDCGIGTGVDSCNVLDVDIFSIVQRKLTHDRQTCAQQLSRAGKSGSPFTHKCRACSFSFKLLCLPAAEHVALRACLIVQITSLRRLLTPHLNQSHLARLFTDVIH